MELRNATGAGMMDCKHALQETGGDLEQAKVYLRKKGIAVAAKKSSRDTNEGGIAIAYAGDRASAAMVRVASETDFVARNEKFRSLTDSLAAQVLAHGDAEVLAQKMDEGDTVEERITKAVSTMGENLRFVEAVRVEAPDGGLVGGYVHSNAKIAVLVVLGGVGGGDEAAGQELAKDLAMHIAASQVFAISTEDIDPDLIAKEKEIYTAQAKDSGKPDEIVAKMVDGKIKKFLKEASLMDQPFVKDPDKTVEQVVAQVAASMGTEIKVVRYAKFQF